MLEWLKEIDRYFAEVQQEASSREAPIDFISGSYSRSHDEQMGYGSALNWFRGKENLHPDGVCPSNFDYTEASASLRQYLCLIAAGLRLGHPRVTLALVGDYQAGYREGITAGKEGALQEGFDSGFADTGAPIGREVGRMRGVSSALLALLSKGSISYPESTASELRDIASKLTEIRFSDICPPDLEAEAHAREHRQAEGEGLVMDLEELEDKNQIESLEDMLAGMSASGVERSKPQRPSMEDFKALKQRLEEVVKQMGLQIHLS
ncbi:hypothetical protein NMY22_g1731 [Coprinellus aureogranulatus]|nr:hypothetical protein NMY22_g1731 [Coprinellus aureogranulatus]